MSKIVQSSLVALLMICGAFSQIENVQFKDLKGKSWDLYNILDEGKFVYIYFTWNG